MPIRIVKWMSLPMLLIGSLFSNYAGSYEFLLNLLVCLGALVVVQRAVSFREYYWAAGFTGIAIVFSPLALVFKVFLLMCFTCAVALFGVYATWRRQPLPVVESA